MALFNGPVDPEKLIGMKPEELKSKLDSTVTKDDLKLVTDQVEKLSQGLSSLDQIKQALEALKPQPVSDVDPDPTDPTTAVLTDPRAFIAKETKGLQDAQLQTQAQLQEMRARQNPKLSGIFRQYGDELVAAASKMPINMRAGDGFWEWHARTFIGDKVVNGKIDSGTYPSLIGSSTIGVEPGAEKDPNAGFDPQVAQWLKERNVPLDKANKISQIMGKNGDPITLANYKSGNA